MSKLSEHENKMLGLQMQMRQNNADLHSFVSELDSWEKEMKQLDSSLKEKTPATEKNLPPVRNSLDKKKKRKVKKKTDADSSSTKSKRISSYDYRSWDKFDVDKACESAEDGKSSSDYETDEEWEVERRKQAAVLQKDQGNDYFKKGQYDAAIECYTKGADLDPTNPLLPANRAMALLKQNKFAAAELDCSVALTLDPLYTKAYLRRGTARMGLKKFEEAKKDYERVLQLEPQNKQAKSDLTQIEKEMAKSKFVSHTETAVDKEVGIVKAISKPPHERSKKSLQRIEIEEVGLEDDHERKSAISKVEASQGDLKKGIMEREGELFQRFTATSPGDISLAAMQNQTNAYQETNGQTSSVQTGCDIDTVHSKVEKLNLEDVSDINQVRTGDSPRQEKTTKGATSSPMSTSPRELSVPVSSFQFQADYKIIKDKPENFYQYFKKINPADYPKLFGQFLDSDVLLRILNIIKDFYIPNGIPYLETLEHLTTVKRFSMVAMFFSKKEKQVLVDIFSHSRSTGQYSEDIVKSLASKYDMR